MEFIHTLNGIMLSVPVLVALLGVGIVFTLWSGFCQYRSFTHGVTLLRGKGPATGGPGLNSWPKRCW